MDRREWAEHVVGREENSRKRQEAKRVWTHSQRIAKIQQLTCGAREEAENKVTSKRL